MRDYPIIKSLPYCCVPASIEAILKRHGINGITQLEIANQLGICASEKERNNLSKIFTKVKYSDKKNDFGIIIGNETLNNLFSHFDLPFNESYISWQELNDINIETILSNVKEDEDAILFFDFGVLYKEDQNIGIGHSGVFISYINEKITYLNPGPRFLGVNTFNSEDFLSAIKRGSGGISIIKRS